MVIELTKAETLAAVSASAASCHTVILRFSVILFREYAPCSVMLSVGKT